MRDTLTKQDKRVLQIADKYVRDAVAMRISEPGRVLWVNSLNWQAFHNAASTALAAYKPDKKKPRKGGK